MKKTIILIAIAAIAFAGTAKAQYRTHYDPFVSGDKYLGLSYSNGGWLSPNEVVLADNEVLSDASRSLINPGVVLQYRRVLENNRIHFANSFFLGFSHWSGKAEGTSAFNADSTWVTEYSHNTLFLTDMYMLMIQIGDDFTLDAGIGLTFFSNINNKCTTTYADGTTVNGTRGDDMGYFDDFGMYFNAMLGAKYNLTDDLYLTCNLTVNTWDIFSLFKDESVLTSVRYGMQVSDKLPYNLMIGFLYAL